jgi:hypothetical protein
MPALRSLLGAELTPANRGPPTARSISESSGPDLSELPHDKICVTSRATLGFHAAWNYGPNGHILTDPEATLMLYSAYPAPVRRWIAQQGGLKPHIKFLSGKPLRAMYRSC